MRYRTCIVCGRKFPEGQGIVISREGLVLEFHSSRCAAKFLRRLLEESDNIECIKPAIKDIIEDYRKALESHVKTKVLE